MQSPATEESHGDVLSPYVISMERTRLIEAGLLCTHVGDPPAVLVTQVEYLHSTTAKPLKTAAVNSKMCYHLRIVKN
jgi:hypothetical protein